MRALRLKLANALLTRLERTTRLRVCNVVIRERYMRRWWLIPRNPFLNVYFHVFEGPDEPVLHDHPWLNLSFVLKGSYFEYTPTRKDDPTELQRHVRKPGDLVLRGPRALHFIEPRGEGKVYTIFITGPRVREWGFLCPDRGWVHWKNYVDERDYGQVDNGCGEV